MKRIVGVGVRLVMHPLWRLSRGLTLGVRAIVTDGDGKVLLIEHTYVAGWHLPGGGVEPGETAVAALARELAEEAAIEITCGAELFGLYANFANMKRDHVAVFAVPSWRALDRQPMRLEISATGFFAPDALPPGTTAGTRRRLAEYFDGAERSAEW